MADLPHICKYKNTSSDLILNIVEMCVLQPITPGTPPSNGFQDICYMTTPVCHLPVEVRRYWMQCYIACKLQVEDGTLVLDLL